MATHLPQNEFMSSASHVPIDVVPAADSPLPPSKSAAANLPGAGAEPATGQDAHDIEALGRTGDSISPTGAIDCIPEIFRVANLLCVEAREFIPDYPGIYQAMLDPNAPRAFESDEVWLDLAPLFLRNVKA